MKVALKTKRGKNKNGSQGKYACCQCDQPITKGQKYYQWQFRHNPPTRQHHSHGHPKQSQLCRGKMSEVYAATETLETELSDIRASADIRDLPMAIEECIGSIQSVKEEYESSRDNMPEHLQDVGTGADMQEKIDALEEFCNSLETTASDVGDVIVEFENLPDEPDTLADHACDCPAMDAEECECGYSEKEQEFEQWEQERDALVNDACNMVTNVLGELSI